MATELIKGKTVEEALKLTNKCGDGCTGGLPPAIGNAFHCSVLAEEAVKAAITDHIRDRENSRRKAMRTT